MKYYPTVEINLGNLLTETTVQTWTIAERSDSNIGRNFYFFNRTVWPTQWLYHNSDFGLTILNDDKIVERVINKNSNEQEDVEDNISHIVVRIATEHNSWEQFKWEWKTVVA